MYVCADMCDKEFNVTYKYACVIGKGQISF